MDKLAEFLAPREDLREQSLLEQAVRRELDRRNLMKAVCSSHRTAGTAAVPVDPPKKPLH